MTEKELALIQEKIGYKFNEQYLLAQAFTRNSYAQENPWSEDNEKLEFVGDKVLDFVVVKKLTELYSIKREWLAPKRDVVATLKVGESRALRTEDIIVEKKLEFAYSEGEMSEIKKQIVQTRFLSNAIERLGLEHYLMMGNGDIKNNVQNEPHVKEDLLEAIIGAVAIDSCWDFSSIEKVIDTMLNIEYYIRNGVEDGVDYISCFQNWHQHKYNVAPNYIFSDDQSNGLFQCYVKLKEYRETFDGCGHSKKEAIRLAAKRAYAFLEKIQEKGNKFLAAIGSFELETAIAKLQTLQDKKLITGLEYLFREEASAKGGDGNPTWFCRCKVDGVDDWVEYGDSKKMTAKKAAAYTMLEILTTGKDSILNLISDGK